MDDQTPPAPTLTTISALDLQQTEIPPIRWVVENLLTTGLNVLASPPKYGKSWLVLMLCLCVANGWRFLGYKSNKGRCLYLALEDSQRRLKSRMAKLLCGKPAPAHFDFATTAHTTDNGLFDELDGYIKANPDTSLIVVDTLQKVRGAIHGREGAYAGDYREMSALKAFADAHNISLVLVHHLRKMGDNGDVFDRISGTNGIFGTADAAFVLTKEQRDAETAQLAMEGRDIEGGEIVLRFNKNTCAWENLGDAERFAEQQARSDYENSPVVRTVKKLAADFPGGWSGTAGDLLEAGRYIAHAHLATSPRELSNKLKEFDKLLLEYDNIIHERVKHGTGGGKHRFYYAGTQEVEAEQMEIP